MDYSAKLSLCYIRFQFRNHLVIRLGVEDMPVPLPGSQDRLIEVAQAALANDDSFEMGEYHTCETTHCIAGWAVHLDGPRGKELENKYGTAAAGYLLLGEEAATHFFDDNDGGRAYLESVLERAELEEVNRKAIEREQQEDFERQLLTVAERNPSLCR